MTEEAAVTPAPRPPAAPQPPNGPGRVSRDLPGHPKPPQALSEPRLTLPAYEPGACHIRVDGRKVGFVLGTYHDWVAYLWPVADQRADSPDDETVRAPRLRDLRDLLRRRLADIGPWWTEPEGAPDGR
jgi:hypothetical protein